MPTERAAIREEGWTNLVDPKVGIWGDDGSPREVDSLSRQVSSEPTLLSLETLTEPSDRFVVLGSETERVSHMPSERDQADARLRTAIGGIPGISELMYMAIDSWRKSQYSIRLAVVTPLARPVLISWFANTISPSLTVRSSSLLWFEKR